MSTENVNNNPTAAPKSKLRGWIFKISALLLLIIAAYFYWNYFNAYSEGDRIGKDIKISTKGNVFKTCEGYITEGCRDVVSNPITFMFSVNDAAVEEKLKQFQLDPNACVRLKYKELRKTLPWRGDSHYLIIDAEKLDTTP